MLARQNQDEALRFLIAQRRLHSRAKRWLGLRWFGMVVIGLAAPVVSVIWSDLAVAAGAVAGLWIFLGRTLFIGAQSAATARAVATQEQFDYYVFDMPSSNDRSTMPSMEEIAAIVGPDTSIKRIAAEEKLLDWYPINADDTGAVAVAIAQRANASYADRLLRTTANVWGAAISVWAVVLIVASIAAGLSLPTFLLGVMLPLLPAFLDIVQHVMGIRRAARERGDLARSIAQRLKSEDKIEGSELQVWQETLYGLRTSTPQVPDFIYDIKRNVNERAMTSAASQLGKLARRRDR